MNQVQLCEEVQRFVIKFRCRGESLECQMCETDLWEEVAFETSNYK